MMRPWSVSILLLVSLPVRAEEPEPPSRGSVLTVRGSGHYEQKPDFARFDVTIKTKGKTLDAAAEAHTERATRGLALLRKAESDGITIEKSRFQMNEERPMATYRAGIATAPPTRSETPFTALTSVTLRTDSIDRLNDIASRLAASGLFEIGRITFSVGAGRTALDEARRAAVLDAREQARIYAEAADLKLVEIVSITDGEARPPDGYADMPMPRFVQIIPPAKVDFEAAVTITWRIAPR